MLLSLIFISFFNFLILLQFGRFLSVQGNMLILIIFNVIKISFEFIYFLELIKYNKVFYYLIDNFSLISFFFFDLNFSFYFDFLTLSMMLLISIVSFFVQLYSISYMRYDPQLFRFLAFLNLFTFCMYLLISSGNLIQFFFGQEGVGSCSYLLINFQFTRINANKSAIKAMLVNKIGDIALLISISLIYLNFRTFDLFILSQLVYLYKFINIYSFGILINYLQLICFFFLIAVVGKSAQIGLHTQLPDAMEGPTPVSALIHAATMVTAGVFLIIRLNIFFEESYEILFLMALIGSITAFFGSFTAIFQYDIKKIIAYSTCSQLGYMVVACSFSSYNLALFHLINHGFFKALLFLSAGVIIHNFNHEQDLRKMGGLFYFLPLTYISFLFGSYALIGLPYFSGFYSKDSILELIFNYPSQFAFFIQFLLILAALCTVIYSYRLIFYIFFAEPSNSFSIYNKIKEGSFIMIIILFLLNFFTMFSGFLLKNLFIFYSPLNYSVLFYLKISSYDFLYSYEFQYQFYKQITFFIILVAFFLCFIMYFKQIIFVKLFLNLTFIENKIIKFNIIQFRFFNLKQTFDLIYNRFFLNFLLNFSYFILYKKIEKNFLDFFYFIIQYILYIFNKFYNFLYNGSIQFLITLLLLMFIVLNLNFFFNFLNFEFNIIFIIIYLFIFFILKF